MPRRERRKLPGSAVGHPPQRHDVHARWETFIECTNGLRPIDPDCELPLVKYKRLSSVTSSAGYSLAISYASTDPHSPDWLKRTAIAFNNSANPPSPTPSIAYTYGTNTIDVTDPAGQTWRFTTDASGRLTGIRRPGHGTDSVSYVHGAGGTVTSATTDGVTDTYSFSTSTGTMTVTDPATNHVTVVTDLTKGRPTSYQNELGKTWSYQYDSNARLTRLTAPEGNYTSYGYDARGNVTTLTDVAKSGSGFANIVTSASFDAACSNIVKRNKPNTTTDALGNVTNYTYDSTHGGVTKITQPAPATGAVRPETRYSYTQVTSAGGTLVWMPTKVAACQTLASCTNAADETQVTAAYNSNLLPTSVTRRNGTGTVAATSTMTYDPRGNMLTVDGPLSGTADTTAFKYDAADRTIGAISPDPDGAGSLKNRAIKITYRQDGRIANRQTGTTVGQTDSAFANMVVSQGAANSFDFNSRIVMARVDDGQNALMQTQFSYDSLGRLDCTAVRMDIAQFVADASLSACTLGANTDPRDRIAQNVYDAAGQVTQVKVAVGTSDAATERTLSYTSNGMLATLKDGENNLTTFEYDGFDRLSKTRFPNPTKGSGTSSTTDYELLTYDANSNVLTRRQRDTNITTFQYDDLDRLTFKKANNEVANTFVYDNLGRMTSAAKAPDTQTFTYDALSRNLTQAGPQGTLTSEWDLAGRRTKLTYPGTGLYLNYDYLLTGETTKVRQNGATSGIGVLATYGYDDLGNRTSAAYGNGASQAFGYDIVSRLSSLTVNLSGTANDLTKTFSYNPASQIVTETRSNVAYSQVLANISQTTVTNGLNQLATVNGTAAAYDGRGNMTTDPVTGKTYSYLPSNNQLYNIPSPFATFEYDALDRLADVNNGGTVTNYVTDGTDVVAEYNASNVLQKRYAFDGSGQPLVQYDAAGNRTWMLADERGSIIALANDSAAMTAIDTYDEYGIPGASNQGTFQYAGMMWLVRPGVYAPTYRAYNQLHGVFHQIDPIGFGGGINLYNYTGNDAVNFIDPLGLDKACTGSRLCDKGYAVGSYVTSTPGAAAFFSGGYPSGSTSSGCGGGSAAGEIVVCGFSADPQIFWPTSPLPDVGAILLPGPFSNNPDPNVVCGADCTTEVTVFGRRKGSTPWMLNRQGFVPDPAYSNRAPWLDVCLTPICGIIGGAGLAALTPEAAWFFGPAGPAFGHPAFGAASRGVVNVGRTPLGIRAGFGRFRGNMAQFRLGVMNWKLDLFQPSSPGSGGW